MDIFIQANSVGYAPDQVGRTLTVGELIDILEGFDENARVLLRFDRGYRFGPVLEHSFEEE